MAPASVKSPAALQMVVSYPPLALQALLLGVAWDLHGDLTVAPLICAQSAMRFEVEKLTSERVLFHNANLHGTV